MSMYALLKKKKWDRTLKGKNAFAKILIDPYVVNFFEFSFLSLSFHIASFQAILSFSSSAWTNSTSYYQKRNNESISIVIDILDTFQNAFSDTACSKNHQSG